MECLYPYRQTKTRAFFKEGNKKVVIELVSKKEVNYTGDKISKTLMMPVNFTPNLSELKINYKLKPHI